MYSFQCAQAQPFSLPAASAPQLVLFCQNNASQMVHVHQNALVAYESAWLLPTLAPPAQYEMQLATRPPFLSAQRAPTGLRSQLSTASLAAFGNSTSATRVVEQTHDFAPAQFSTQAQSGITTSARRGVQAGPVIDASVVTNTANWPRGNLQVPYAAAPKQCIACGETQTPKWRGENSRFCNACGLRFARFQRKRARCAAQTNQIAAH